MHTNDPERRADEVYRAAKKRMVQRGQTAAEQQMMAKDPAVHAFVTRVASDALSDRFAGLSPEARTAVRDAIWHAAVLAMEAQAIHKTEPEMPMASLTRGWMHRLTGGPGASRVVATLSSLRVRNPAVSPRKGNHA